MRGGKNFFKRRVARNLKTSAKMWALYSLSVKFPFPVPSPSPKSVCADG